MRLYKTENLVYYSLDLVLFLDLAISCGNTIVPLAEFWECVDITKKRSHDRTGF